MQNIQDLKERIFFEAMNIIDNLDKISNIEKLLSKQDLVDELSNRIAFLKLLEKNIGYFVADNHMQNQEKKYVSFFSEKKEYNNSESEITKEEAVFNNCLNEINDTEISAGRRVFLNFIGEEEEDKIVNDSKFDSNKDLNSYLFSYEGARKEGILNNQLNVIDEQKEENREYELVKEVEFTEVNDIKTSFVEVIPNIFDTELEDKIPYNRKKIVEVDKLVSEEPDKHRFNESFENVEEYHQQQKKIKLANIKGIKTVHSIFYACPENEDPRQESISQIAKEDSEKIFKSNIPTIYIEADKLKAEFKLDLNDRLAFTKMLFNGSQEDLNNTVCQLNQFKTLDEAKEYLSDLYYEKKWSKVDEYAQRFWILVENKFL